MMSSSATLNRQILHRQTAGILNANYIHFIPISLLFLPITSSASLVIRFYSSASDAYVDVTTTFLLPIIKTLLSLKTVIIVIAFALFVILPTIAGIAFITYSTNRSIYGKPVTFSSAIKSLSHSYIPLLSTVLAGSIELSPIFLLFSLCPIAITRANEALGFHFDLSIFSIFINSIRSYVLATIILAFLVRWGSAAAIAVLESKSGFDPLRQSANQSSEFRSHSSSIVFISAFVIGSMLSYSALVKINIDSTTNWISILQVGVSCLQASLTIVFYVVANTVLYVQFKVARGEELAKTAVVPEGEDSRKYVSVSVDDDDDEVPNSQESVTVVANGGFTHTQSSLLVVWCVALLWNGFVNHVL